MLSAKTENPWISLPVISCLCYLTVVRLQDVCLSQIWECNISTHSWSSLSFDFESYGLNLSCEFGQTEFTSAVKFRLSGSNVCLLLACQFFSRTLPYWSYQPHNKSPRSKKLTSPPWHSCVPKYFLRHNLVIRSFWPRATWRHFPVLNSNLSGIIIADWESFVQ